MKKILSSFLFGFVCFLYYLLLNQFNGKLEQLFLNLLSIGGLIFLAGVWGRLTGMIMLRTPVCDKYEKVVNNVLIVIGVLFTILTLIFYIIRRL